MILESLLRIRWRFIFWVMDMYSIYNLNHPLFSNIIPFIKASITYEASFYLSLFTRSLKIFKSLSCSARQYGSLSFLQESYFHLWVIEIMHSTINFLFVMCFILRDNMFSRGILTKVLTQTSNCGR